MFRFFLRLRIGALVLALLSGHAAAVRAQQSNFIAAANESRMPVGGWTITPGVTLSTAWDDNVLMKSNGDEPVGTNISAVNPRVSADYRTKHTDLSSAYDGSFLIYQDLGSLNSYDQRAYASLRHQANRRLTLFVNDAMAFVPTTELVAFVGVPFVRTGSAINEAHGGAEFAVSKRTTISGSYNYQWISFDPTPEFANTLRGGHGQGVTLSWRRTLSALLVLTADYDYERSTVTQMVPGNPIGDFNIHNGWAGLEFRLSPTVRVSGSAGVARTGISEFGSPRTGPAWRGALTYQKRRTGIDLGYTRSFVPSYSFGGTLQNEEVNAHIRYQFTRKLSARSLFSWRSNQSLIVNEPNLDTVWFEGSIGYSAQNWLRVEGFFIRARQTIDRPGGTLDRNRVGMQIVTSNPLRVR